MSKCLGVDAFVNRQEFQQADLGTGTMSALGAWFPLSVNMFRNLAFILPSESVLSIKPSRSIQRKYLSDSEKSLGLLQVFLIYIIYQGLVRERGRRRKRIAPCLLNHAEKPWAKLVTWESQAKSLKGLVYFWIYQTGEKKKSSLIFRVAELYQNQYSKQLCLSLHKRRNPLQEFRISWMVSGEQVFCLSSSKRALETCKTTI